jgi:hypothetical protein
LRADRAFREFHEGRRGALPEFYHDQYERALGRYAELISRDDRRPDLAPWEAAEPTVSTGDRLVPVTTMRAPPVK